MVSTWRLVILSVSAIAVAICGISSSVTMIAMIEEINREKPADNQISMLGSYLQKNLMVYREYRRLYPDGHLHIRLIFLAVSGLICLLLAALAIGII